MKMKPYFLAKKSDNATLQLDIYAELGADWLGDGITAGGIKSQIGSQKFDQINIRINSPGGDAFEGIAIGNMLRSFGVPIKVSIDGLAASAASVLAMCGDDIEIAQNGLIMIHNAWSIAMGESSDLRKMADTLDTVSGVIAETYVSKTGKSLAEIKSMMDAETWLTADQSLAGKFVNRITGYNSAALNMARNFKALASMRHLPEELQPEANPEPSGVGVDIPAAAWNVYEAQLKRRGIFKQS